MDDTSSGPKRRVYDLPQELVDRIVEFQKDRGLPSEVEAVRRLLDQALKGRDTIESIVGRYLTALGPGVESGEAAGAVLSGHPLVRAIDFEVDGIAFKFQQPNTPPLLVTIKDNGEISIYGEGRPNALNNIRWEYDPAKPPGKRLFDSMEIPF